jgi:hypothetical protein
VKGVSAIRYHYLLKTFWLAGATNIFPIAARPDQMREGGLGDQWGDWPGTHAHARRTDDSLSDKGS